MAHRSKASAARASAGATVPARWCWKPNFRPRAAARRSSISCLRQTAPISCGSSWAGRAEWIFTPNLWCVSTMGRAVPWVNHLDDGAINAIAGPERLVLRTPATLYGEDLKTLGEFRVEAGQSIPFVLSYGASFQNPPPPIDPFRCAGATETCWRQWSDRCPDAGPWTELVKRSLITLKALTYAPTGGIVAAATTSLPERLGGIRNWDYRYCWLRDATFTLLAFMQLGYYEEARAWRDWLIRAVAGSPSRFKSCMAWAGNAGCRN